MIPNALLLIIILVLAIHNGNTRKITRRMGRIMATVADIKATLDSVAAGVDSLEAAIADLKAQVAAGKVATQEDLDALMVQAQSIGADIADTSDQG